MKTLNLNAMLALTAVFAAAIAPAPATAGGLLGGGIGAIAGGAPFKGGQCIGACGGVHHAVPVGGRTATPTRTPIRMTGVPAPQPLHVAPPPGQGATAGRMGTIAPPPAPGRH